MIDEKVQPLDQCLTVIEGQLSNLRKVVGKGRETQLSPAEIQLVSTCLTIIVMAVKSVAK